MQIICEIEFRGKEYRGKLYQRITNLEKFFFFMQLNCAQMTFKQEKVSTYYYPIITFFRFFYFYFSLRHDVSY